MFLLPTGPKANPAIKMLSRSILSPKQQLMLLQVGKRLIVVGDSGGNMNALCEISDPDEVAALVGEIKQDRPESVAKSFRSLFGRAKEPFDEPTARESAIDQIEPPMKPRRTRSWSRRSRISAG